MSTVMKTGDSVVPCLFVQPPANASAARAVIATRSVFLMSRSPLRPEDPRRDEYEQFVVLFGPGLVLEQVPEDRDLPEARDHVVLVLVVDLEDASDDGRPAI